MARKTIGSSGSGADYMPQTGETMVDVIERALDDGHRWLVFPETNVPFDRTLDLDPYGPDQFFALEGGGITLTNFNRTFENGPMIRANNDVWHMYWRGINFQGQQDANGDPTSTDGQPLTEITFLDRSLFVACGWFASGGDGASFGRGPTGVGIVSASVFQKCEFSENRKNGCNIYAGRGLDFTGQCHFERNGKQSPNDFAGLWWEGNPNERDRGLGVIHDCHFEHDIFGHRGLWLIAVEGVDVQRNWLVECKLRLQSDTNECLIDRIYLTGNATVENESSTNIYDSTRNVVNP